MAGEATKLIKKLFQVNLPEHMTIKKMTKWLIKLKKHNIIM
jgi:hypothetical protein